MDLNLKTENATFNGKYWLFKGKVDYVDEWYLMKTPFPLIFLTVFYLMFVLKIGPSYMKKRPPYNLQNALLIFNIYQVAFSMYLTWLGTSVIWPNGLLSSSCLMETKESRYIITSSTYAYFIAKVVDLLDTVFFVLRKKNNQISFLHVYHHFVIMWCTWLTLKYEPTYSTIFLGTLNSWVHVIMYTYYGLSTFPALANYLWWKKYITGMQLTQFVLILVHAIVNLKYSGCPPSNTLMATILINGFLFLYLFGRFYINSYTGSRKSTVEHKNGNLQNGSKSVKTN